MKGVWGWSDHPQDQAECTQCQQGTEHAVSRHHRREQQAPSQRPTTPTITLRCDVHASDWLRCSTAAPAARARRAVIALSFSKHLRRHTGRCVMWVHGKVAGKG